MCGLLGHTDKVFPDLFELESDDGVRNRGPDLKPNAAHIGSAANNKWLQDPIPFAVLRHHAAAGVSTADRNPPPCGAVNAVNFSDHMLAVDNQISALKHDLLAAQNLAKAKHGSDACQIQFLSSSSTGT